ncbi:hypothetical protein [Streptomyces sp. FH025]|uniref:hypothetical protein n=1 Tax=Streptomyces sp. FH025 TaxID=2815937 RepID=UPI001FAE9A2E|nr:hypothetical protein [Streptomyces sp. FH025]
MVITASGIGTATATCPAGKFAVGGGFQGLSADIASSLPVGGSATTPATGWQVNTLVLPLTEVTAFAVCAP